jgi:threonine dehydratase
MLPVMEPPTFDDVLAARETIAPHVHRTPLLLHPLLAARLGAEAWVKHENHQVTGAFKVRGGVNLVATLSDDERRRGLICVTRGNHGQSLAYAGRRFGVRVVIVVPEGNNPEKNAAMEAYGGELIVRGRDFNDAMAAAEDTAAEHGCRYVHSANEPALIAGVGTYGLEIFDDLPEPDYIFVPVGLGSGICGVCTVAEHYQSRAKIIGVQTERAPAVTETFRQGRPVRTVTADTFADGLATRAPAELTMAIMRRRVDDMVLVSEEDLTAAVRTLWQTTHNLAEGAGAAALAAANQLSAQIAGKKVVLVLSGGNLDTPSAGAILSRSTE